MYPFGHVRGAQHALWAGIREHLDDAPEELDFETDLHEAWHRPDLILGQTCGWPLVTELDGVVEVIGTFAVRAPFAAADGHYRSVLVAAKPLGLEHWQADPTTRMARNNHDSLSGWVSFCAAWGGIPENVLETGAHLESMRAIAAGRADVAAIDGLSFEFIAECEPMLAARMHVIGHAPVIPCVPLVMANALADRRDEVRAAISAALVAPELAWARERLRIRGFVPFDVDDYASVRELLPTG